MTALNSGDPNLNAFQDISSPGRFFVVSFTSSRQMRVHALNRSQLPSTSPIYIIHIFMLYNTGW